MSSPQKDPINKIVCPGCGRDLHFFHLPAKPGVYRLRCRLDGEKMIRLQRNPDQSVKLAGSPSPKKLAE